MATIFDKQSGKAERTNEQIEQKKQQLKQLAEEVKALTKELVEAGAIELSEGDLDKVAGGWLPSHDNPEVVHPKRPIDPGEVMPKERIQPSVKL